MWPPAYPCCTLHPPPSLSLQIGALQGSAQLMAKASGSLSGTLADLLSPAWVLLVGAALSCANKPMYAAAGRVASAAGATACAYWILFAKARGTGCGWAR